MKKFTKVFVSLLCILALALPLFAFTACGEEGGHVDYVSKLPLNFSTNTKKQEVVVRLQIDGDTTHFDLVENSKLPGCDNVDDFAPGKAISNGYSGYAKARYLAINTPESTGQIEPWGKAASDFTKGKLKNAERIVIESDDEEWHTDANSRYLLWVWYIPEGGNKEDIGAFRNLNIEILQEGYAWGSSTSENRYGSIAQKAKEQAQAEKLIVYSGEKDPNYDYSTDAKIVDLKELRFNPESYVDKKICTEGLVVADFDDSLYIENVFTDVEGHEGTEVRIGMPVLHFNNNPENLLLKEMLVPGNYVKIVGVLIFSEIGGYYQITGMKEYNEWNDNDPNNCKVIEKRGLDNAFTPITVEAFKSTERNYGSIVNKDGEETLVELTCEEAIQSTSVSLSNLKVTSVYTTASNTESNGAMTIYGTVNGQEIQIRTIRLYDSYGKLVTADVFFDNPTVSGNTTRGTGKTINVKGIVELYKNTGGKITYQVKCFLFDYIEFVG